VGWVDERGKNRIENNQREQRFRRLNEQGVLEQETEVKAGREPRDPWCGRSIGRKTVVNEAGFE
jgi:hypothetical protein